MQYLDIDELKVLEGLQITSINCLFITTIVRPLKFQILNEFRTQESNVPGISPSTNRRKSTTVRGNLKRKELWPHKAVEYL